MKIYLVGGAVRDKLLARDGVDVVAGDRDWVVVGTTPEAMVQQGFRPVGNDFPVFLHPVTHEEYALARTERKTTHGYHGFAFYATPEVTLEEDLKRRDLTINAMALDEDNHLIDPFDGEADLKDRVLRHVGPAFVEDPVRVLRLARFAARFPDFSVAPETETLLAKMVSSGETDHLVAERLTAELSRGLMERAPLRMLDVLERCGFWAKTFPEAAITPALRTALEKVAAENACLAVRIAILFSEVGPDRIRALSHHLRLPNEDVSVLTMFVSLKGSLLAARCPEDELSILERLDCIRRPKRLEYFLAALSALVPQFNVKRFAMLAERFRSVDAAKLVQHCSDPKAIPALIHRKRLEALKGVPYDTVL